MITGLRRWVHGASRVVFTFAMVSVAACIVMFATGCIGRFDINHPELSPEEFLAVLVLSLWLRAAHHHGLVAATPAKVFTAPVAQTHTTLYLGAAAHVAGAADTDWRTDCEVLCTGPDACTFTVETLMHGQANPDPASREYTLPAGHALRLDDVLLAEFGRDGKAALRVTPSVGAVIATDRTYNLLAAGNALGLPPGATFGQYIPAVRGADAIGFGDEGRLIQLSHTASGGGFRTNLGLVNLTGAATAVTIDLFEADGSRLGAVSRTLAPYEYRQLGNVFASVSSSEVADGYAVVRTTTDGGRASSPKPRWSTTHRRPGFHPRPAPAPGRTRPSSRRKWSPPRPTSAAPPTPTGAPTSSCTTPRRRSPRSPSSCSSTARTIPTRRTRPSPWRRVRAAASRTSSRPSSGSPARPRCASPPAAVRSWSAAAPTTSSAPSRRRPAAGLDLRSVHPRGQRQ